MTCRLYEICLYLWKFYKTCILLSNSNPTKERMRNLINRYERGGENIEEKYINIWSIVTMYSNSY